MEADMRYRKSPQPTSIELTCPIFGVAFNPVTSTWRSFHEDMSEILSEHSTESEALAACRGYVAAQLRRMNARPLSHSGHRAI
jgi:hypothetical protein